MKDSPRHISKTHGTHNRRYYSWPHLSDRLDRPDPPPNVRTLYKVSLRKLRRHARVRHPLTRIAPWRWTARATVGEDSPPSLVRYTVRCACAHGPVETIQTHAYSVEEAARNATTIVEVSLGTFVTGTEVKPA